MILYTTGSINQPDAGSVGLAIIEQIRDDVIAHDAWELVEEFTPASSTVRWYVLKCLASESGLPNDFYVIFMRRLSDGLLYGWVAEDYNVGTHTASFFCSSPYTTVSWDSQGRPNTSFTLSTTWPGTGQVSFVQWAPGGTSTKWWIIVDDDRIAIAFNGPANGMMELGAYTPVAQTPIPMPLMISGSSAPNGSVVTRNPLLVNNPGYLQYSMMWGLVGLGFAGRLDCNDRLNSNKRPVAEYGMVFAEYNVGDRQGIGWAFGKRKGLRYGTNPPAGVAFGDAYVLEDRLWVPYVPNDTAMWDTGVAAS